MDQGYQVPKDISVIGFDDISISQHFTPKLSTFHNPINLQGITASKMLLSMVEKDKDGRLEQLNGKFIPRESSGLMI